MEIFQFFPRLQCHLLLRFPALPQLESSLLLQIYVASAKQNQIEGGDSVRWKMVELEKSLYFSITTIPESGEIMR